MDSTHSKTPSLYLTRTRNLTRTQSCILVLEKSGLDPPLLEVTDEMSAENNTKERRKVVAAVKEVLPDHTMMRPPGSNRITPWLHLNESDDDTCIADPLLSNTKRRYISQGDHTGPADSAAGPNFPTALTPRPLNPSKSQGPHRNPRDPPRHRPRLGRSTWTRRRHAESAGQASNYGLSEVTLTRPEDRIPRQ